MTESCSLELTMEDLTADFGESITKVRESLSAFGIKANPTKNAGLPDGVRLVRPRKEPGIGERSSINLIQMKQVFVDLGDIVAISVPTTGRAGFSKLSTIITFEAFVVSC